MATAFNLTSQRFPIGTSVAAYPVTNWPNSDPDTSAVPTGSATETQTKASNGIAPFVALASVEYVAYASVGGTKTYVFFVAGAD